MRSYFKTRIFLDSGDPKETREIKKLLGFLDGQTTNPTLIAKHPDAKKRLEQGKKFTPKEIFDFYKKVVQEISSVISNGSVSVEVYADKNTTAEQMIAQAREMFAWIPNAHMKFPTTTSGLTAASKAIAEGMRVNMTLCFSQEQAAAVHAATKGAAKGDVFVSPFVGRLDDRGENGMDLIANILQMYKKIGSHVEVLTASVRTLDHFLYALWLGSDIITAPFSVLVEWAERKMHMVDEAYHYDTRGLKKIPYREIDFTKPWQELDVSHDLTEQGLERFSSDWNTLIL